MALYGRAADRLAAVRILKFTVQIHSTESPQNVKRTIIIFVEEIVHR